MGHQEAGNPAVFPVDFTVPDDSDDFDVTSVNVAFEALADRTAWLKAQLSSSSMRRAAIASPTFHTTHWTANGIGSRWTTLAGNDGGGDYAYLYFPVLLPNGCTVTSISVLVNPANGHGGVDPSVKCQIRLMSQDLTTGSLASLLSATDTTTPIASYEAMHEFSVTGSVVVSNTGNLLYLVAINNEQGGVPDGLIAWTPRVTFTPVLYPSGGY